MQIICFNRVSGDIFEFRDHTPENIAYCEEQADAAPDVFGWFIGEIEEGPEGLVVTLDDEDEPALAAKIEGPSNVLVFYNPATSLPYHAVFGPIAEEARAAHYVKAIFEPDDYVFTEVPTETFGGLATQYVSGGELHDRQALSCALTSEEITLGESTFLTGVPAGATVYLDHLSDTADGDDIEIEPTDIGTYTVRVIALPALEWSSEITVVAP